VPQQWLLASPDTAQATAVILVKIHPHPALPMLSPEAVCRSNSHFPTKPSVCEQILVTFYQEYSPFPEMKVLLHNDRKEAVKENFLMASTVAFYFPSL
jgi:hypothetical protein